VSAERQGVHSELSADTGDEMAGDYEDSFFTLSWSGRSEQTLDSNQKSLKLVTICWKNVSQEERDLAESNFYCATLH